MATSIVYVDQGPTVDGSALAADNLNTAVVAQGYVIQGGLVDTSITGSSVPGVGVDLYMLPTAAVVVNSRVITGPPTTTYVFVPGYSEDAARALVACQFSADNYIDLFCTESGPTSTGSYIVTQVAPPGGPAPALDPAALRLCVVTMSATGFLSQQQLASPCPLNQEMVAVDPQELAAWDPIPPTANLVQNLDRIRFQLGALYARVPGGGEWTAPGTLEPWDTSQPGALQPMVPWSTRGVANGVAELDPNARLPVGELPFAAVFTAPSTFSNGAFVDPCPAQTLAVKVSGGLCVDTLTAQTAYVTQLYATEIGSAASPVSDEWVTNLHATTVYAGDIVNPTGGPLSIPQFVATQSVSTPTLYVDSIHPYTAHANICDLPSIDVYGILNGLCQVQGASLYTGGSATVGSLGVAGTATVGSTLGVASSPGATGGQLTVGTASGSLGAVVYGPITISDTAVPPNPASLTIGANRYSGLHADLMVAGDGRFGGDIFCAAGSLTAGDVNCNGLLTTTDLIISDGISGNTALQGDLTLETGGVQGSGSLRLRRLIYDRDTGPSAYTSYSGAGSQLQATDRATNTDNYGYLDFATGSSTAEGDQFRVAYSVGSTHAAHPGVFLMLSTQGATHTPTPADIGHVYISQSDSTGFTVAFSNPPPTGVHYRFIYHVVE